jgi:hypothetical protein
MKVPSTIRRWLYLGPAIAMEDGRISILVSVASDDGCALVAGTEFALLFEDFPAGISAEWYVESAGILPGLFATFCPRRELTSVHAIARALINVMTNSHLRGFIASPQLQQMQHQVTDVLRGGGAADLLDT